MRFSTRQMTVVMVLLNDHHRGCAVNHPPFFLASFVDHPVIPACTTNSKIWNIEVRRNRNQRDGVMSLDDEPWTIDDASNLQRNPTVQPHPSPSADSTAQNYLLT